MTQQEDTILRTNRILIINDKRDDDGNDIKWLIDPLWSNGFHVEKVNSNPFKLSELLQRLKRDSFQMIIFSFPITREYADRLHDQIKLIDSDIRICFLRLDCSPII
jgi:hypothetical protein